MCVRGTHPRRGDRPWGTGRVLCSGDSYKARGGTTARGTEEVAAVRGPGSGREGLAGWVRTRRCTVSRTGSHGQGTK